MLIGAAVRLYGPIFGVLLPAGAVCWAQSPSALVDAQVQWVRSERPPLIRPQVAAPVTAPVPSAPNATSSTDAGLKPAESQSVWVVSTQDKTLYRTFLRWAAQAQYQLLWQVDRDFAIESDVVFEGEFRKAVSEVMLGIAQTDYPLQAIFNPGTRVIRVVRWMDEKEPRR